MSTFDSMEMENNQETAAEKETRQTLTRSVEKDILGGLMAAAGFKESEEEIQPVEIKRGDESCFTFHIRPLSEDEYYKCREKYTTYKRNKQLGIRMPEDMDNNMYRNALIYEATIEKDRLEIWDNKEAWRKLDVMNGIQLIGQVLKAGEKDAVLDLIDQISGYDVTMEEAAKNS